MGVAGSFAMNLVNVITIAAFHADDTTPAPPADPNVPPMGILITGAGSVVMTATSSGKSGTSAKAKEDGEGATAGIGASVGLNLVNNDVFSGIDTVANPANGPPVGGATDITVKSSNTDSLTNETEAGAQKGSSATVAAAITVSIANESSVASLGAASGTTTVTGKIEVEGEGEFEVEDTAKGATKASDGVAVGLALVVAAVDHTVSASSLRSLEADDEISLTASGTSSTTGEAEAAAEGAPDSSGDGAGNKNTNQKGDNALGSAKGTQAANNKDGKTSGESSTPKSSTSDNSGASLSVAAAIVFNMVTTSSTASFANGISITSNNGQVSLATTANTDAHAKAKGDTAVKADVNIGAGLAINDVDITNAATTGNATIHAAGLGVSAGITDPADSQDAIWRWNGKKWVVVASGAELPGPAKDDFFVLTATDGSHQKGVYKHDGSNWVAQAPTNTVPTSGETFPTSPAANAFFILTEAKDGHPANSLWQWDGTAWKFRTANQGEKLPTGGPADKDFFQLTENDGTHAPGVYKFQTSDHTWQLVPGTVAHGTAFPGSPSADQLFRLQTHEIVADAYAGAGDSNKVGVAGALALNIVSTHTRALVNGGATVVLTTGDSTISALSNEREVTKAQAKAEVGSAVGVGAAASIQVLTGSEVRAEVQDGAGFTGGAKLTMSATGLRMLETSAVAGTKGGDAISPVVALTLDSGDTVVARLGAGAATTTTGAVRISASHTLRVTSDGDADAAGKDVSIGAVVLLPLVLGWSTKAELARNLTAGARR